MLTVVPSAPPSDGVTDALIHTPKILLVDGDRELLELLTYVVQRAGFRPIRATDGLSALQLLDELRPDLLVLASPLGAGDGLEVLGNIRRVSEVPIIVLSSLDNEDDVVRALERGADDYVTKPIAFRELVARIGALLRRRIGDEARRDEPADHHWMRVGMVALNPREQKATLDGLPLALTRTEFRLLQFLMDNAGKVVSYRVLLNQIWGYDDPNANEVVRAALSRLRRKLEEASDRPQMLRTVPGVGVMLECGPDQWEASHSGELDIRFSSVGEHQLTLVAA